jgi:hypothetical protein
MLPDTRADSSSLARRIYSLAAVRTAREIAAFHVGAAYAIAQHLLAAGPLALLRQ